MNSLGKIFFLIALAFFAFPFKSTAQHRILRKGVVKEDRYSDRLSRRTTLSALANAMPKRVCYTMEVDKWLREKYPSVPSKDVFEIELAKRIGEYKKLINSSRTQAATYVIPVVVHIVHSGQGLGVGPNISAAQVQSQINVLNNDFRKKPGTSGFNTNPVGADVEIEFALALRDPQGNTLSEPGIHRVNGGRATWNSPSDIDNNLKPATQWDPTNYLNIWTVTFGGSSSELLGYAQFPSLSGLDGLNRNGGLSTTDGVVISHKAFGTTGSVVPPYGGGRTTTHEIGHWLGLRHIWGDDDNCQGTDYCSDTPIASEPNYGCPAGTNTCSGAGNDMVENYMDYTDDDCMNVFSLDQKSRMRAVMENSPRRKELVNSDVHLPGVVNQVSANFDADKTSACPGSSILFTDKSSNTPTAWKWYILNSSGTTTGTSSQQNPSFTFNSTGSYGVALVASNPNSKDSTFKAGFITIISSIKMSVPFSENFEGSTVLPNWTVYNPDKDREWELSEDASAHNSGTWSVFFDNYDDSTDPTGKVDALISSGLDLNVNKNLELTFDLAYSMYDSDYPDTLAIYYSTDCGQSFKSFWEKGGPGLATAPSTTDYFIPSSTEWRKERISLAFLNGEQNVQIGIANISGWGNNLYIDNIHFNPIRTDLVPISNFSASQTNACVDSEIRFTDQSENLPNAFSWNFPGGTPASSSEMYPKITYRRPGVYNVSLTTTNVNGTNTKTLQGFITIVSRPTVSILASKQSICEGDSVELAASGGQNYVWSDNRGVIGRGNSIKVRPALTNRYFLKGENSGQCEDDTSMLITVSKPIVKPLITLSDTSRSSTITLNSSSTVGNQWLLNGTVISGAVGRSYDVKVSGSYAVQVTVGGCSDISDAISLTPLESAFQKSELSISPNPVKAEAKVSFTSWTNAGNITGSIYNSLGIKLEEGIFNRIGNTWEATFKIDGYPSGNYFIVVVDEFKVYAKALIKQ